MQTANTDCVFECIVLDICHTGGFALVVADDEGSNLDSLYGILVRSKEALVMARLAGRGCGEQEPQDGAV